MEWGFVPSEGMKGAPTLLLLSHTELSLLLLHAEQHPAPKLLSLLLPQLLSHKSTQGCALLPHFSPPAALQALGDRGAPGCTQHTERSIPLAARRLRPAASSAHFLPIPRGVFMSIDPGGGRERMDSLPGCPPRWAGGRKGERVVLQDAGRYRAGLELGGNPEPGEHGGFVQRRAGN